jgi:hypothetical protein
MQPVERPWGRPQRAVASPDGVLPVVFMNCVSVLNKPHIHHHLNENYHTIVLQYHLGSRWFFIFRSPDREAENFSRPDAFQTKLAVRSGKYCSTHLDVSLERLSWQMTSGNALVSCMNA